MRTTIRLHDGILQRAKQRAADEGRTLTSLIEEGLRIVLDTAKSKKRKRARLPISKATGGLLPGMDLNSSRTLEDLMDER